MLRTFFVPKVKKELQVVQRLDVVFDTYIENSLKGTARKMRGKGIRRKVEDLSQAPSNWASFLRIDKNKTELFKYLSEKMIEKIDTIKDVVAAFDDQMIVKNYQTTESLAPCNHEEADSRVFLHAYDMGNCSIN